MNTRSLGVALAVVFVSLLYGSQGAARDLTFEDRVKAQEAIERVYYSHQIGATKSFEEAVPRDVLEKKVRTYLKQSVALEKFWHTPVTAEMLHREMERMANGSRMPDRLRELYAALGNDPFLIQECLARSTLVDRLTRNFFAYDGTIHAEEQSKAEALRRELVERRLDPFSEHPNRTVLNLVRVDPEERNDGRAEAETFQPDRRNDPSRVELSPEEFERWQRMLPEETGAIGPLVDDREAFVIRVVLERRESELRVASFAVPKSDRQDWWSRVEGTLDESSVEAVASIDMMVQSAGEEPRSQQRFDSLPLDRRQGATNSAASGRIQDDTRDNGFLDDVPDGRAGHTAVWTGSLMVVWGGSDVFSYFNTGGRYDPATDTWTSTSTTGAPSGRTNHTAVWTGSQMIVWGGNARFSGGGFLRTGGRYDPATDGWTRTSTVDVPTARSSHTAVWTGSVMVVWGGFSPGMQNTGGRYDPTTDTWTPTSTVDAPRARSAHTAVWTGSLMVVWGGTSNGNPSFNTGGRYDPATDSWTPTSTVGAPKRRYVHTAVWTGSLMVVWGGTGPRYRLNTGGRYDPATDRWRPTTTTGAPSGRLYHRAVWTGSLMVVWGGDDGSPYPNTGGRYDPTMDMWTPTSTADAPSPRILHTAVWTGSLMVVWGGGYAVLNTGGRYDPATDSWTPTSTGAAPTARNIHTSVWTGSLMVVWAGSSGGIYLDTGGRYDPATDSWMPTSTVGAPSGRGHHTAVWTGSVMVVWGGVELSGNRPNTGGRYDPATNNWTPTSTVDAPTGRINHTAVWTGSVMIVWGGYDSSYANTGGRYDPTTDSWTPTSTVGAPTERGQHTAVWTGSLMIVWGGLSDSLLNTGGSYEPTTDSWTPISTVTS